MSVISATLSPFSYSADRPYARSLITTLRNDTCSANVGLPLLRSLTSCFGNIGGSLMRSFGLGAGVPVSPGILAFRVPNNVLSGLLGRVGRVNITSGCPRLLRRVPHMHTRLNCPPLMAPADRVMNAVTILGMTLNHCGVVPHRIGSLILNGCNHAPTPVSPRIGHLTVNGTRPVAYHPTSLVPPRLRGFQTHLTRSNCPGTDVRSLLDCVSFPRMTGTFFNRGEWTRLGSCFSRWGSSVGFCLWFGCHGQAGDGGVPGLFVEFKVFCV